MYHAQDGLCLQYETQSKEENDERQKQFKKINK